VSQGELILYTTEDGGTEVRLRVEGGTAWLSQAEISTLFQTTKQNVSIHIRNIISEGELPAAAVVKDSFTTAADGKRYLVKFYNLDAILAIGYRVRSARGTQFRQWATTHLREYLVKGFVMDDERLKNPGGWDYFDDLLKRIRDIRASEKRFYQKVRDIFATSVDYDPKSQQAQLLFKKVQNKMLWAVTGKTAAELISSRADATLPNMGLTAWHGHRAHRQDVIVAKNYLQAAEIDELNRIVTMYLDYAEDQAKRRKQLTMVDWEGKLDAFLTFNERDILTHAGKVSAKVAEALALVSYEEFDTKRREAARLAADRDDLKAIEGIEKKALSRSRSKRN
jgi:hypothetical protein